MQDELYADGIGEITVTGSIVRINLVSLSAVETDASGNPKAIFRQRVVMPIEGFANAVDLMSKALAGLVEAGALRRVGELGRSDDPALRSAAPLRTDGRPVVDPNASPNFN